MAIENIEYWFMLVYSTFNVDILHTKSTELHSSVVIVNAAYVSTRWVDYSIRFAVLVRQA